MNFDSKAFRAFLDDECFKNEMIDFLQRAIDDELNSEKDEIDCELINDCTDMLLSLQNESGSSTAMLTPLLSSSKLLKRIQNSGSYSINKGVKIALIAAVIAGMLACTNAAVAAVSGVSPLGYISAKVQETLTELGIMRTEDEPETTETGITQVISTSEQTVRSTTEADAKATEPVSQVATPIMKNSQQPHTEAPTTAKASGPAASQPSAKAETTTQPKPEGPTVTDRSPQFESCIKLHFDSSFKTAYYWGESLDLSGMTVTYYDEYGDASEISPSRCSITGYNKTKLGEQTVTVRYGGCSESFTVTLTKTEATDEKVITGVEGTAPTKQIYTTDDTRLLLAGLKVRLTYSDGSFSKWYSLFDAVPVGTVDFSIPGEHTVTLLIDGKANYTYTIYIEPAYIEPVTEPTTEAEEPTTEPVTEPTTQPEEPTSEPTTQEPLPRAFLVGFDAGITTYRFKVGDDITAGNIKITAYYSDESSRVIYYNDCPEDFVIKGLDTSAVMTFSKYFNITYKGFTEHASYIVYQPAEPTTEPEQPAVVLHSIETDDDYYTFYLGDKDFDVYINAYYSNKTTEYLSWKENSDLIKVYGLNTETASSTYKTFTVTYKGKQTTAHYRVLDLSDKEVEYAEFVDGKPKFLYYEGEPLGYTTGGEFDKYVSTNAVLHSGNVEYKMRRLYGNMLPIGIATSVTVRYSDGSIQSYYGNELRYEGYHPDELGYQKIKVFDKSGNYLLSYLIFVYGDEGYCPLFRMDYLQEAGTDMYIHFAKCIGGGDLQTCFSGVTADLGDGELGVYQGSLTLKDGTVYPLEIKNVRKIQSACLSEPNKLYFFNADDPSSFYFGDDTMELTFTDGSTERIKLNDLSVTYYYNLKLDLLSDSREEITSSFGSAVFMLKDENCVGKSQFSNGYNVTAKILYFRDSTADQLTLTVYGKTVGVESNLTFDTNYTEHLFLWNHNSQCELNAIENSVSVRLQSVTGVNWGAPGRYRAALTVTYLDQEYVFYKYITITE